jgi:hypothetical protein
MRLMRARRVIQGTGRLAVTLHISAMTTQQAFAALCFACAILALLALVVLAGIAL